MRMADLSRETGVPTATIKWYLREGLLPRGATTRPNQAEYTERHVGRIRLIRTLAEIGGLAMADIAAITAAVDDPATPIDSVVAAVHGALARVAAPPSADALAAADAFVGARGWSIKAESPGRRELAAILAAIAGSERGLGFDGAASILAPYADALEPLAAAEITGLPDGSDRDAVVARVVAGTVLVERAIGALRRLAQEDQFATLREVR
ncbi:MAG: MerR family transcriptional regulator [Chloroflexota bacterium]